MIQRYLPVQALADGEEPPRGEEITPEVFTEMAALGDEERAAQQHWMNEIRAGR